MAVMLFNLEKTALLSEMERRRFFWGGVCISISAVTAAYGSALTAGHFWKSAVRTGHMVDTCAGRPDSRPGSG
ncbi:hypothetical protein C1C98_03625 [Pseudomonas ogarae]|uniref:Uncharacterized protein n=1 Tax=Pseudomonas ogarae (strain DSM 112162 / CECT 30235 / F113) TaxID=1114970 RepID=A0ABN5G171_PSEO1|nr:hypothetical protein C1C98_03625 [Pseudomonas ogarae]